MSTLKDDMKAKLDSIQKGKEIKAIFWQFNRYSPRRQMKVIVSLDKIDGFTLDGDALETRRQRLIEAARAQPAKSSIALSADKTDIGPDKKTLQEKSDALALLYKMKSLSTQLTPAQRSARGRCRTTHDVRGSKPKPRAPTPYPRPCSND